MAKSGKRFGVLAALLASLAAPTIAQAQERVPVQKPFRVRAGVFLPKDGDTRDVLGNNWFAVGVSYDIQKTLHERPNILELYLDYTSKGREIAGTDVDANIAGLGIAYRLYGDSVMAPLQKYFGAGVGVYRLHAKISDVTGTESETATRFGGKLLAGLQLNQGLFAEVSYTFIGKINDVDPGGALLYLGFRF